MRTPKLIPSVNCNAWWVTPTSEQAFWHVFSEVNRPDVGNVLVETKMAFLGAVTVYSDLDQSIVIFDADHCAASCILDVARNAHTLTAPYIIKYRYDGWCTRVCETKEDFLELLGSIFQSSNVARFPTPLRIETLVDIPPVLLDALNNPGSWSEELFIYSRGDQGLVYDSIGRAAPAVGMLGEKWRVQTTGKPFDAGFEDTDFDRRTAMAYNEVLNTQKPSFSRVSGALRAGKDVIYQNYDRVILPLPGAKPRVASLAVIADQVGPPY